MQRILQARQRPPTVPDTPSNVGGIAVDGAARLYTANPGDTIAGGSNAGDFVLEVSHYIELETALRLRARW